MDAFNISVYSFAITFVLLTIYASLFPSLRKFILLLPRYAASRPLKPHSAQREELVRPEKIDGEVEIQDPSHFPPSWWTDPKNFSLEHRAIFSQTYHLLTHTSLFPNPGSYHTFTLSTLPIFLIRGKDSLIRGFHNVCRHRAYEVTRKECGTSLVLGCRYHGWSYDTRGRLVKAPEFEGVEGFEKAENGLWELGVRVVGGLVYVKLDGREGGEKKAEDGACKEIEGLSFEKSRRIEEWKIEGIFNWKLAAGHTFAHILAISEPASWLAFLTSPLKDLVPQQYQLSASAILIDFPRSGIWLTIKILPHSPTLSHVHGEVYMKSPNIRASKSHIHELQNRLLAEMKSLEILQQKLIDGTTVLRPEQTAAQNTIQEKLKAHMRLERIEGREIHPAARQQATMTQAGKEDDELCRLLEKGSAGLKVGCPKMLGERQNRYELEW